MADYVAYDNVVANGDQAKSQQMIFTVFHIPGRIKRRVKINFTNFDKLNMTHSNGEISFDLDATLHGGHIKEEV